MSFLAVKNVGFFFFFLNVSQVKQLKKFVLLIQESASIATKKTRTVT